VEGKLFDAIVDHLFNFVRKIVILLETNV